MKGCGLLKVASRFTVRANLCCCHVLAYLLPTSAEISFMEHNIQSPLLETRVRVFRVECTSDEVICKQLSKAV